MRDKVEALSHREDLISGHCAKHFTSGHHLFSEHP